MVRGKTAVRRRTGSGKKLSDAQASKARVAFAWGRISGERMLRLGFTPAEIKKIMPFKRALDPAYRKKK